MAIAPIDPKRTRLAVIGAGPIGLEAALVAARLGFETTVLEAGTVGSHLRQFSHVRLFSPWWMNVSPLGLQAIGGGLPGDRAACPTAGEYVDRYLAPLARCPELRHAVREATRVVSVSRDRTLKGDFVGDPRRGERPFRLLADSHSHGECGFVADVVIDATGTYASPRSMGPGGQPAIGERKLRDRVRYHLPDVLGRDRAAFEGKRTLLVGAGYSAATTLVALRRLARRVPGTSVVWATREEAVAPFSPRDDDPLESRRALEVEANAAAEEALSPATGVERVMGAAVEALRPGPADAGFVATLATPSGRVEIAADNVVAHVGFEPDSSLHRELQVHQCYASEGPMKLAAALLGETSADCLAQASHGADALENPEPRFFILGAKSYGRNSRFLMRAGRDQVRDLFTALVGVPARNLFAVMEREASVS